MAPFTRNQFIAITKRPAQENFLTTFNEDHAAARSDFEKALREGEAVMPNILPGSIDTLNYLQSQGIPMGIVSNKQAILLREDITLLRWSGYFQTVVGSGDAAFDKPRPDPLLYALETMNVPPGKHVWMVGDMESDIEAAHCANVTAVLIETTASLNLGLEGDLDTHKPDLRVSDARALMALLQNQSNTISVQGAA